MAQNEERRPDRTPDAEPIMSTTTEHADGHTDETSYTPPVGMSPASVPAGSGFSPEQERALAVAHALADAGVPIFTAHRNHGDGPEFHYPNGWQDTKPGQQSHNWINRWRPGMALCMVTGVKVDVVDVDPRNGGAEGQAELESAGAFPRALGVAATPSAGHHHLIPRTHLNKGKPATGVDLQAGADDGTGRGFVFMAPTVRVSKFGPDEGREVAYRWEVEPDLAELDEADPALSNLVSMATATRRTRRPAKVKAAPVAAAPDEDDPFDVASDAWTPESADRVIQAQLQAVEDARNGEINSTLGGAARMLGRFVAGGHLDEDEAAQLLLDALERGGVHSDRWNIQNRKNWTAATVIAAGMANGQEEPWTVVADEPAPASPAAMGGYPSLEIGNAAEMAYWLQGALGSGRLAGFFRRSGRIVYTPRVGEAGYVHPEGEDEDNGPMQVQPATKEALAAEVQYLHRCYRTIKDKDGNERERPAMFPVQAASTAIAAPHRMGMLRNLKGVVHTPVVRPDGSILAEPGYDEVSGFLYAPEPGLAVPAVSLRPSAEEVAAAVALLDEMVAGFEWRGKHDRANLYGLLLTPLMRLVTPPPYKLFAVDAHQPGSGKTLLANTSRWIHGGVFRTEMPDADDELKKLITSILYTTTAPVVVVDNVTGSLTSSTLAGLLTSRDYSDRVLGRTENITLDNDRVWTITGNNVQIGGDLGRRTVTIAIDPGVPNPQERTGFAIADLEGWVKARRGALLHALLTLITNWTAAGQPLQARAQSDGYARWESAVGAILERAGVPGEFDAAESRNIRGDEAEEGWAGFLEALWDLFGAEPFYVADLLSKVDTMDNQPFSEGMLAPSALPSAELEADAKRGVLSARKLGKWIGNRQGRWAGPLTVVPVGAKTKRGQAWQMRRYGA